MNKDYMDGIAKAAQLGRLDLISLLLAAIGLILVCGGFFAFLNFRSIAKAQATKEATRIAGDIAERTANEYLQNYLPEIMDAYKGYSGVMNAEGITSEGAGEIANTQDNSEKET